MTEGEFLELYRARADITAFLEDQSIAPPAWFFEGSQTKRVELTEFRDIKILNVREMRLGSGVNYGELYPTRVGFAISKTLWRSFLEKFDEVITFLEEVKRVYDKIKESVVGQLSETITKMCYGCETDHPSQTKHECVMYDWNTRVEMNFTTAMSKMSYSEITGEFASNTFLDEQFCEYILCNIACISKKLLLKSEDVTS